jgi:hypothetical protein
VTRGCRTDGAKSEGFSRGLVTASRVLMGLIAALLVVAPWTEHYGTFDNFPRGGDVELSLLAFLGFLCLVLLLAQLREQRLKSPPPVQDEEWEFSRAADEWDRTCAAARQRISQTSHSPPFASCLLGAFNLPLQI